MLLELDAAALDGPPIASDFVRLIDFVEILDHRVLAGEVGYSIMAVLRDSPGDPRPLDHQLHGGIPWSRLFCPTGELFGLRIPTGPHEQLIIFHDRVAIVTQIRWHVVSIDIDCVLAREPEIERPLRCFLPSGRCAAVIFGQQGLADTVRLRLIKERATGHGAHGRFAIRAADEFVQTDAACREQIEQVALHHRQR